MTLRLRVWISGGWGVTCLSSALACLPPSDLGEPGPPGRGLRARPGVCTNRQGLPRASERASERARRELCPRGKGSAPCSGRIPTLCVSLAAQTQRARHGGESGSQGPPDCLPACLPLARGEAAPPPASQPASQPASVFSLRVCVPRKRPPDWASPELSSRAETCVWMWCGGPSFRASLDGWGRKEGPSELPRRPAELQIRARAGASARSPGREAAQSALGEGASPSRSRLLAFAPGKEGRKEGRSRPAAGVWECGRRDGEPDRPQLRSRLPSPLGPRRAGASRQRAPGPPGRVYKPPRPPASERASERASEERALSEGEGKRPVLGPHSHAVCELGRPDSASAARRGIGVPGPA